MTTGRFSTGMLLVLVIAALAGCGLGPGKESGTARLVVTRDYGGQVILQRDGLKLNESANALRLLDGSADLKTAYGGGFVQSVNGISGGAEQGRRFDWFYSVNGVVAERGSAEFPVRDGDTVWWDYRDWTDAMTVGAQVGAYPQPLAGGYDGRNWPVALDCPGELRACEMVRSQLDGDGVKLAPSVPAGKGIRVIVTDWPSLVRLPEGRTLNRGPAVSGVFARFAGNRLTGLDAGGTPARDFGPDAGLVAAMRTGDGPPVWVVTGGSAAGVELAAAALNPADLARRYAAVVFGGRVGSLPWPGSGG